MKGRLLLWCWLALMALSGAETRYHNPRYGFELEVPKGFRAQEAPTNQDGRTFSDGTSELLAWGSNNVLSQTLDEAYREAVAAAREEGPIGYQAAGKTWFVVTWVTGPTIIYQKTFLGAGCSQSFRLSYPLARKSELDPIVKRLEASFKPGDLTRAH